MTDGSPISPPPSDRYSSVNSSEDGEAKHNIRACHIGNDRFHIIIDLNVNETPKPVNQLYQIEMYRVYRGSCTIPSGTASVLGVRVMPYHSERRWSRLGAVYASDICQFHDTRGVIMESS
jgi:hypothetical protein